VGVIGAAEIAALTAARVYAGVLDGPLACVGQAVDMWSFTSPQHGQIFQLSEVTLVLLNGLATAKGVPICNRLDASFSNAASALEPKNSTRVRAMHVHCR
jgi:hypothetical protein